MQRHGYFWRSIFIVFLFLVGCSTAGGAEQTAEPLPSYRYDPLPPAEDISRSIAAFRALSRWHKFDITYYFDNGTDQLEGDLEHQIVRDAFALWAAQTPLSFKETADAATADIEIAWLTGNQSTLSPFDGPGGVLAQASFPNPFAPQRVFLQFDATERWVDSTFADVDLLTVAVHEIGHALGLGHSRDPNAIMFDSYSGPRRRLSDDDIAGIQTLYGINTEATFPEQPDPEATAPPTASTDSDGDGLSDAEERLVTGTDPNKADTDGDGLDDGVEVLNRLNPRNPDMDRDGVSDGAEVAAGTNPFFPDQRTTASPELINEIRQFLNRAIQLEIRALREGDAALATPVLAQDVLATLERQISALKSNGQIQISAFDYYSSYIAAVRVINNARIEVDTCETWSSTIYQVVGEAGEPLARPQAVSGTGPELLPQTLVLSKLNIGWRITAVQFQKAPAFCNGS